MTEEKAMKQDRTIADEALNKADIETLHRLYNEKCQDVDDALRVIEIYTDRGRASARPNDNTISAIKEIALSAIELARDVAIKNR